MKVIKLILCISLINFSITNLYRDNTLIVILCLVGIISAISIIYLTFKSNILKTLKQWN